jgi:hypothetical protein
MSPDSPSSYRWLSSERVRIKIPQSFDGLERLHAVEAPRELQDIGARITRLRERLRTGDADMAPDEIQAAIDRAEEKRHALLQQQPAATQSAKILKMPPQAAHLARW